MFSDLDVLHDLEQIVKAKPEGYVDPHIESECVYFRYRVEEITQPNGTLGVKVIPDYQAPSCIVGHVFAEHEIWVDPDYIGASFLELEASRELFDPEAQMILCQAQCLQDGGERWDKVYETVKDQWEKRTAEKTAE